MEQSKGYFNEIAGEWDTIRISLFSEQVREYAYDLAKIQPGMIAADIGAGTGFVSEGLLERGVNVIAIDQSENMLNHMKDKFHTYKGFTCLQGDSDYLPLSDNSVDYVFANMFLHHVVEPQIALKEMYRILKPKGIVVITDLDEHNFTFLKEEQYDIWMGFNRDILTNWLINVGFLDVSISCVGCNCCSPSAKSTNIADINIFAAYGIKS